MGIPHYSLNFSGIITNLFNVGFYTSLDLSGIIAYLFNVEFYTSPDQWNIFLMWNSTQVSSSVE